MVYRGPTVRSLAGFYVYADFGSGRVFAFRSDDVTLASEATLTAKGASVAGSWVEIDWNQDANAYDAATRAEGAFGFVRIEDRAADPKRPGDFWFDTTGRPGTANPNGRLYRLEYDPKDVLRNCKVVIDKR